MSRLSSSVARPDRPSRAFMRPAKTTCGCPADASSRLDKVTVTGHESWCDHAEPRRYAWLADNGDGMTVGTLHDYAIAWATAHERKDPPPSRDIRTWDEEFIPAFSLTEPDDEGLRQAHFAVGAESTYVPISAADLPH